VSRLGDGFRAVIDDVCSSLRAGVREYGGHEVEARADEYFAAFASPAAAVAAAVATQRALASRRWPEGGDVRVRVGIHSGYPTSTATNYIGVDVHTTARICGVGHGGQIVVSANTREGAQMAGDEPDGHDPEPLRRPQQADPGVVTGPVVLERHLPEAGQRVADVRRVVQREPAPTGGVDVRKRAIGQRCPVLWIETRHGPRVPNGCDRVSRRCRQRAVKPR
jgi:hypothetical protein